MLENLKNLNNLSRLERLYLDAKIKYYTVGSPIMSDGNFDLLEKHLKELNSKVINQVGSKVKDFDFPHNTKMLSLNKIQTEVGNDKLEEVKNWYYKRCEKIKLQPSLTSTPKLDGNAINLIYTHLGLTNVITRGDGICGKDITDRINSILPKASPISLDENDCLEIRCEVVISKSIFDEKWKGEYMNPRNFVAGILGSDEFNPQTVKDLKIAPLNFLLNSKHISYIDGFKGDNIINMNLYTSHISMNEYTSEIANWEALRLEFPYQIDGVVLAFPEIYREQLGENDHDPEWAIAIKLIPELIQTEVTGIEWNVGKTGELTPVVLLMPVELMGTTVKRATAYNAGFINKNSLGIGTQVGIIKAGDIIPEIVEIYTKVDKPFSVPELCPSCTHPLKLDGIHLVCPNNECSGKSVKILNSGFKLLDIKGVGIATLDRFSEEFTNGLDLLIWLNKNLDTSELSRFGFDIGSKSHKNFINSIKQIKELEYWQIIQLLGINNVGSKISIQVARYLNELDYDFKGHDKSLLKELINSRELILDYIDELRSVGIEIIYPKATKNNSISVCLTGSPKEHGFKTKGEFLALFNGVEECDLSDSKCQYLITDSYSSTSSKMAIAKKKSIEIITYSDFKSKYIE